MNPAAYKETRVLGSETERAPTSSRKRPHFHGLAGLLAAGAFWLGATTTTFAQMHSDTATGKAGSSSSVSASTGSASSKDQLPNAVLLATAGSRASIGPLDSVIQAALEKLGVVTIAARPGMDLNAVQLAIDCVSETPQCLRAVANQTQAQILIAPSLQNTQSELVLSLLRFDVSNGQMRRVLRRQTGSATLKPETLDGVPNMLRELFNIPEPAPQPAAVASESKPTMEEAAPLPPIIEPPQEPAPSAKFPLGPFLLAGGGALVLGGGAVVGAIMLGTQSDGSSRQGEVTSPDRRRAVRRRWRDDGRRWHLAGGRAQPTCAPR
jgi:hypothetical protein